MSDALKDILDSLGIEIIACNQTGGAMKTKAINNLRRILARHGEGHVIITLRTIVESAGNERALTSAAIFGVSDLILAHPTWPERGLTWIEAFDEINLIALAKMASANRKAVPKREAMATMLYERLAPTFDPPPVRKRAPFKHSRTTPRYAHL